MKVRIKSQSLVLHAFIWELSNKDVQPRVLIVFLTAMLVPFLVRVR